MNNFKKLKSGCTCNYGRFKVSVLREVSNPREIVNDVGCSQ